jgi:PAS domain S-box-containing protein
MKDSSPRPGLEYLSDPVVYQLIEASNDGFWDWNVQSGEVYFSRRWAEMLGYRQDEIEPHVRSWEKLVHPDDMKHVMEVLTAHLEGKTDHYETEHRVRCKSGEWKWILDRGQVISRDQEGKPLRAAGSHTDINEKILYGEELQRLNDQLKNAINLRNRFLSIASHELKTPLTSLVLIVQSMKRILGTADRDTILSKIAKSVVQTEKQLLRLTGLIDDMLDISRIESGKFLIKPESFKLSLLIQEVAERLEPQLVVATNHPLSVKDIPNLEVNWDRYRIEQVLTNLITNAIRYGGGKPVSLLVEKRDRQILLSIKDQGIGVPVEDRERIFNLFERGISEEGIRGLGLGLYITKQIVLAHNGKIWVESNEGGGSIFFIEIPI